MPLTTKPSELIRSDVPTKRPRSARRLAKRCTSGNQANGLGQASSTPSCALLACVGSSILELVLETDPHLVFWMTRMRGIECEEEGERATCGNLENCDEKTWSGFCIFWMGMLEGIKEKSVEINAFSDMGIWACSVDRIAKKMRALTIIENCYCRMPDENAMKECGEMKIEELKILVLRPNGQKVERNIDYLGTDECDRNEMPSDESMGYTETRQDDKIGATRFLLELNKFSTGIWLVIEKVTVSTIIMCETKDEGHVHWHNTFVPHGDFTTSWGVASYMTRLLCHFNTQSNALLSRLAPVAGSWVRCANGYDTISLQV